MLDNSGPYGPNEVAGNIGQTTNRTQIVSSSVSHNFNGIGKLGSENSQQMTAQYNALDSSSYNQEQLSINNEETPYLSSSSSHIHRTSYPMQTSSIHVRNDFYSYTSNTETNSYQGDAFQNNNKMLHSHSNVELNCKSPSLKTSQTDDHSIQNMTDSNKISQDATYDSTNNCKDLYKSYNTELSKINSTKELSLRAKQIQKTIQHIDAIIASDKAYRKQEHENNCSPKSEKDSDDSAFDDNLSQEPHKTAEVYLKSDELSTEEELVKVKEEVNSIVTIEVEKVNSWTYMEYLNPFARDCNGVTKDDLDLSKFEVIGGDNSIVKAAEKIGTDLTKKIYYECPNCPIFFTHPKRFLVHVKWHSFGLINMKRQELAVAKQVKRAQWRGEATDQVVTGKTYPCSDCDKVFTRPNALRGHKTKCHKNMARECNICKVVIGDWQAYRDHQTAVHTSPSGFKCTRCDKVFKYKHTLAKHEDSHEEKTISCPHCPKLFGSELLLRDHSRSHERVQKGHTLHCAYCGKGYFSQFNLQVHERTHRNEKPFQCDICEAKFSTNSSLTRHLRVSHNSSKPHACPICHRCFESEASLLRHHSRFHLGKNKEYDCEECHEKFKKIRDLRRHTAKMHPKEQKRKVSDSE